MSLRKLNFSNLKISISSLKNSTSTLKISDRGDVSLRIFDESNAYWGTFVIEFFECSSNSVDRGARVFSPQILLLINLVFRFV